MKKIFIVLTCIVVLFITINYRVFATNAAYSANISAYGFTVTGDISPLIKVNPSGKSCPSGFAYDETINSSKDKLENETLYILSYFSFDDAPEIKGIIYRITTKPYQPGRYWGFLGIGSYGDDFLQDSVNVKIQLPSNSELMSYAPMAKSTSYTISVGASIDSSGEIGLSYGYSYLVDDLTIINNSSSLNKLYNVTYDYNQNNWNEYTTSELYSYGMLLFRYSGENKIPVEINVNYYDYNGYEGGISSIKYSFSV